MELTEHKRAKELYQKFLANHISETQRIIARLSTCECEHLGGTNCICVSNELDETTSNDAEGFFDKSVVLNNLDHNEETVAVRKDSVHLLAGCEGNSISSHDTIDCRPNRDDDSIYEEKSRRKGNDSSQNSAVPNANVRELSHNESKHKKIMGKDELDWSRRMVIPTPSGVNIKPLIKQSSVEEQQYEGLRNPYIIVVNNCFTGMSEKRSGADDDEDNLNTLFRNANFKSVQFLRNKTRKDMFAAFERMQNDPDLDNHDGLICFLMSHGNQEGIMTADRLIVPVDKITAEFRGCKCKSLSTKPKLFFVQACRGMIDDEGYIARGAKVVADSDLENDLPIKLPSDTHFMVAYATTKGFSAYRQYAEDEKWQREHKASLGSWFIACLVQVILAYSYQDDLLSMLTRVNKAMSELYTVKGHKQVSCHLSMLTKKVYFPTLQTRSGYQS